VGEGPGADEDAQGLPFVGRAGKLLTQMIEAMGLRRKDVYICNVVKCRPRKIASRKKTKYAPARHSLAADRHHRSKSNRLPRRRRRKDIAADQPRNFQFRGEWLEFAEENCWRRTTPRILLRNPPAKSEVWKDLQKVMAVSASKLKKAS